MVTASGPFVDPVVTRFGDGQMRSKHDTNGSRGVGGTPLHIISSCPLHIISSCRSAEPPFPFSLFAPHPMLPHTLTPHAPRAQAVKLPFSAVTVPNRTLSERIMFGRASGIQQRSRRAIWLRTWGARSREVVTVFALFRTRGASKRDANKREGTP